MRITRAYLDGTAWIFGYGSLIWRPAFPFARRHPGYITGWTRRFWQGSTDHRGVPGAPGRVVTLIPEPGACCWGMAYEVRGEDLMDVLASLDHREKGGYARLDVPLHVPEMPARTAIVYVATADNPNYLGPAPLSEIAGQVLASRGPSGSNLEYVLRLSEALSAMGAEDECVTDLARIVRSFLPAQDQAHGGV